VGRWPFDEGTGTVAVDTTYLQDNMDLLNAPTWATGKIGLALSFVLDSTVAPSDAPQARFKRASLLASDNFTISMWALPTATHEVDVQFGQPGASVYAGTSGQRYAMFPTPAHATSAGEGVAAVGVSVGTNGVAVYAHTANYMPALVVWQGNISTWTAVAVVVSNNNVTLWLNGVAVAWSAATTVPLVLFPSTIGSGNYGAYAGRLDELRFYNHAISPIELRQAYARDNAGSHASPHDSLAALSQHRPLSLTLVNFVHFIFINIIPHFLICSSKLP
jgi:hypothetical protein